MTTSEPFDFAKYKTPQLDGEPIPRLPSPRTAESNDDEKSAGNLSDLLGQVSKNSTGEIDSLIGELRRLRGKLLTDGDRIRRRFGVSSFQSSQLSGVLWTDATHKLRNVALGKERIKQNLITDFVLMSDRLPLNCLPLRRILVTCHVARTASVDA